MYGNFGRTERLISEAIVHPRCIPYFRIWTCLYNGAVYKKASQCKCIHFCEPVLDDYRFYSNQVFQTKSPGNLENKQQW